MFLLGDFQYLLSMELNVLGYRYCILNLSNVTSCCAIGSIVNHVSVFNRGLKCLTS